MPQLILPCQWSRSNAFKHLITLHILGNDIQKSSRYWSDDRFPKLAYVTCALCSW